MSIEFFETFLGKVGRGLKELDLQRMDTIVATLQDALVAGRTVYLVGNGGSAATASHFASDLAAATDGRLRVVCLSDNVPRLTALANDEGFETVFASQLEAWLVPEDVVIVLSGSGNSHNLVAAARTAQAAGARIIGLLGSGGGELRALADTAIVASCAEHSVVESTHGVLTHVFAAALRARLAAAQADPDGV